MEREWFKAGFFLISGGASPERVNRLLPKRIVTVSGCIVENHPDYWSLPWVEPTSEQLRNIQESIGLSASGVADVRSWVATAIDDGDFGSPDVFLSLRAAQEFSRRFLTPVQGTRLVGLSLAKDEAAEFLREEAPQGGAGLGVCTMLTRAAPLDRSESPLGFDVLGPEYGGSFHTFSCNGIEQDFHDKLGITFNSYGLIDDYSMAVAASEYINREDVGAEPVTWYPFRVDDYTTAESG